MSAARNAARINHAHVTTESADCDGRYSRGYVLEREGNSEHFKSWAIGNMTSGYDNGTLTIDPYGFTFDAPTEEGYISIGVSWCNDADGLCDRKSSFRDHSAEAAGY